MQLPRRTFLVGGFSAFSACGYAMPRSGTGADARLQTGLAGGAGSGFMNRTADGTGAIPESAEDALRAPPVRPEQYGLLTNPTVATATLLRAFTHAMAERRPIELSGHYTINGPITPVAAINGIELHLRLRGRVTITVDAGARAFQRVFFAESATVTNHSITGDGTLTIDCNDKVAAGIWLRHNAAQMGGSILIDRPVTVRNVHGSAADDTVSGIFVWGRFSTVVMRSPTVEDVTRDKAAAECSGICTSRVEGAVELYSPTVRRIRIGAGTADADGIKCFGHQATPFPARARGSVRIYDPTFEDCQGRSYKDQCGDTIIYRPVVRRNARVLVAAAHALEFDFQSGGGLVLDAQVEYYRNGATSPLGRSHSVVAFQQLISDAELYGAIRNSTIISDVEIPRFALVEASGAASTSEVDGLTLIPANGFSGSLIGRGVMEFNAAKVVAKSTETTLAVRNVSGPIASPCIAYTSYTRGDLSQKLSVEVDNCSTTLPGPGRGLRAISDISGNQIMAFRAFRLGRNPGFRNE